MFQLVITSHKKMNQDLKNLLQWLKPKNLSLNVKKAELIIFYPKKNKLDYSVKFKLNAKRLNSIEYLEIFLRAKQVN